MYKNNSLIATVTSVAMVLMLATTLPAQSGSGVVTANGAPVGGPTARYVPEKAPETAAEYYDYADKLWRSSGGIGVEAKTLELLNKAIELKPDYAEAFNYRGIVEARTGKNQKALADFSRTVELSPEWIRPYESMAMVKIELKDFRGALVDYDTFISRNDARGSYTLSSLMERGRLRYFLGDYNGALEDFSRGIAYRQDENCYFLRGATYIRLGNKLAALQDLRKVVDMLDPMFARLALEQPDYYTEKMVYPESQNPLTSVEPRTARLGSSGGRAGLIVNRVMFPGSSESPTLDERFVLNNWFDLNSSKTYFTELITTETALVYYQYGMLLLDQGRKREAELAFTKSIVYPILEPDNPNARFQRGLIRLENREFEPAVRDFSWAISKNLKMPDALLERGIAILMLGRDQIAQKDFDAYLALNPKNADEMQRRIDGAKKLRAALAKENIH